MSEKDIGQTRFVLDPLHPPTMSQDAVERLRALPDEEIDLSDLPEHVGAGARRVLGPRFRGVETIVALEDDVMDYFRQSGEAPAIRINAVLREYVEAQRKRA